LPAILIQSAADVNTAAGLPRLVAPAQAAGFCTARELRSNTMQLQSFIRFTPYSLFNHWFTFRP
jgi:hypothetical protein